VRVVVVVLDLLITVVDMVVVVVLGVDIVG
jgi:hypothetical protein